MSNTSNMFKGLGIGVAATSAKAGEFIPFQPNPNKDPVFSFMSQIDTGPIRVLVKWNPVGERYFLNIIGKNGKCIHFGPLIETPSQASSLKINLLLGLSSSKIYFYEDTQSFHIIK